MGSESAANEVTRGHGRSKRNTAETLSYRRIADILAKVEGTPMPPRRVAQICRAAEMKLAFALLADWDWCQRLRSTE
jgi:hypothetical protein